MAEAKHADCEEMGPARKKIKLSTHSSDYVDIPNTVAAYSVSLQERSSDVTSSKDEPVLQAQIFQDVIDVNKEDSLYSSNEILTPGSEDSSSSSAEFLLSSIVFESLSLTLMDNNEENMGETLPAFDTEDASASSSSELDDYFDDLSFLDIDFSSEEHIFKPQHEEEAHNSEAINAQNDLSSNPTSSAGELVQAEERSPAPVEHEWMTVNNIVDSLSCDIGKMIAVFCPMTQVRCDYVQTILHQFGNVTYIKNRWIPAGSSSIRKTWGGIVATYSSEHEVEKAERGLPFLSKFIKAVPLRKIAEFLAESEASLCQCKDAGMTAFVQTNHSRGEYYTNEALTTLLRYGLLIRKIELEENDPNIICEFWFMYITQAYVMKYALDDLSMGGLRLQVEIFETDLSKKVLKEAKKKLQVYLENLSFP